LPAGVTVEVMGKSFAIVMKEFCQIFRAYVMNRRHKILAFLYDFSELLDARLTCCESPVISWFAPGLFQCSPVRNPTSESSTFKIAGTTIYFLLSQLN